MFIDQTVIKSQPKVFESFVDALLDMVSKVNSGPDRLLRATVCIRREGSVIALRVNALKSEEGRE